MLRSSPFYKMWCAWWFCSFLFVYKDVLPECVAKGSRLTWESEGRAVFGRRCFWVRNRPQPFELDLYGPAVGESSWKWLGMDVSRVSLRRYYIVLCIKVACHARKVMDFASQAQGIVKVTQLRRSYSGICNFRVGFFRGVESRCHVGICSCKVASKAPFLWRASGKMSILKKACESRNGQNHSKR